MRLLTISDKVEPVLYDRFDRRNFPPVDLILSCGDLPPEYLTFVASVFDAPLFYVRGNHDIRYENHPLDGCRNLDGRVVRHGGLKFLGLEGSRWYNGGPIQYTERQMRKKLRGLQWRLRLNRGIDVVITHAPPRHVHDADDPCHRGFRSFLALIERHQPRYLIHGHIHRFFSSPEERVTRIRGTRVINTFGYQLIEVNDGQTV